MCCRVALRVCGCLSVNHMHVPRDYDPGRHTVRMNVSDIVEVEGKSLFDC